MTLSKKKVTRKKTTRKKTSKKKGLTFISITRLCVLLFLVIFLVFSVCTVGYVIFFRTVLAQEILPGIRSGIVFEEPNSSNDLKQLEEEKIIQVPNLPKIAIVVDTWFVVS